MKPEDISASMTARSFIIGNPQRGKGPRLYPTSARFGKRFSRGTQTRPMSANTMARQYPPWSIGSFVGSARGRVGEILALCLACSVAVAAVFVWKFSTAESLIEGRESVQSSQFYFNSKSQSG